MPRWWLGYAVVAVLVLALWWVILSTDRPDLVLGDDAIGVLAQRGGRGWVLRVYSSFDHATAFRRDEWAVRPPREGQ